MADNSRKVLSIKFVADGIADVQKQIEELGKAGSDAAKTIADAFAKTKIGAALSAQLDVLNRRFADVAAAGQAFGSSFTNVQRNLSAFTGAIQNSISRILQFKAALALATAGVAALFKSFGNNAEKITQTASALGVTTDQYQRLSAAAKDVGIEQGALDRILAKFTIGVEDAGDKADEASEKTKKLSGSLEQLAVKAEDGSTKIVTIRRGITDAGKEAEKFSGITQTGVEGLLAYAKALDGAGSASEKLAKAAKDFGSKNALQAVLFFENLTFQFDENKRAAAGLIKPLTDLELLVGNRLDQAFDNLGTNLSLIKDRLLAVFAPAVTKVVESFTKLIQKNETQLVAWATTLNEYVLQIVQDFIAIMSGDLQNVSADNKWLVDLVTGVQEFGAAISYVFTEVVPAAFRTLREYANQAAGYINAVFGTDFTGDSLLIVIALGYVTGAFSILTTGITLAISVIGLAVNAFGLLGASIGLVTGFLKPLAFAIGYVGAALAAIIGAPAWVGIAIVAALAAAGALIYAYWDEIAAYASATWDSIVATASSAISAIANDFSKISTEWSAIFSKLGAGDLKGAFDEIYNQSVAFWSKLLANTQNDIRLINEALKAIGIDLPAVWTAISDGASAAWDGVIEGASSLGTRLSPIWESVKASAASLWSGVEATARTIWNNVASIISSAASGIAEAVGAVWTAASTAISGATAGVAETADSILNSISQALAMAGSIQGAIDLAASLVAPFSAAKDQIIAVWDQLRPALEAKGAEIVAALATPLAELKSLPTAFSEAANAIPGTLSAVIPSAEASMLALSEIILGVVRNLAAQINEALGAIGTEFNLDSIVEAFRQAALTITEVWSVGMTSVVDQTSSMVSAVESLIASLISYLNSLKAAIAAAQNQARGSSGSTSPSSYYASGGYISGRGTGTSDSIPMWGSNGEFMLKARAVKHWGLDFLYALNSMRMPAFAAGGFVGDLAGSMVPRGMARPLDGATSRLSPYTLVFEGQKYPGFMGPSPDALRQIGKARVISRIASNNRVPKWKG